MNCTDCIGTVVHGAIGLVKVAAGIDRATTEQVRTRRDACRVCEHVRRRPGKKDGLQLSSSCAKCKCNIAAKTLIAGETCPEGKWPTAARSC